MTLICLYLSVGKPQTIYIAPITRIQVCFGRRWEDREASTAFNQSDGRFQGEHNQNV